MCEADGIIQDGRTFHEACLAVSLVMSVHAMHIMRTCVVWLMLQCMLAVHACVSVLYADACPPAPPFRCFPLGAAMANASRELTDLLGAYLEAIGISFQIIDDVLNLRGTLGKTLGEDITAGKITFPVAMALPRLKTREEREQLWTTLMAKPTERAVIDNTIALLESCGAIDASMEVADKLVNNAWANLDKVLPASLYKMQLRAFGFYVLQQVY